MYISKHSGIDHTVLPANTPCLPFLRMRSPDGATSNWGKRHLIAAYYSSIEPQRDKRLSWPGWLTHSGRFTHKSGHPSATGPAQDRESTPAEDRRSTTEPRNQPLSITLKNGPAHVAQWSQHSGAMCSGARCTKWPGSKPQPGSVRLPKNYF